MAESKYLDSIGLTHAWAKIKEWLGGGTFNVAGTLNIDSGRTVKISRNVTIDSTVSISGSVNIRSGSSISMSGGGSLQASNGITIQAAGSGSGTSAYSYLNLRNDDVTSDAMSNRITFTSGKTWAELPLSTDCGIHLLTNSNEYTTIKNSNNHTVDLIFIYNTAVGGRGGTTSVSMKHSRLGPNEYMNYTNYTEGTFFIMFWISRFDLD